MKAYYRQKLLSFGDLIVMESVPIDEVKRLEFLDRIDNMESTALTEIDAMVTAAKTRFQSRQMDPGRTVYNQLASFNVDPALQSQLGLQNQISNQMRQMGYGPLGHYGQAAQAAAQAAAPIDRWIFWR